MITTALTPARRIVVAADYPSDSDGRKGIRRRVLLLARQLKDLGVYLKTNSALRALGYDLLDATHGEGLLAFADLKLTDIRATLERDGELLAEARPELLTVSCPGTKISAMRALKAKLPDMEVLGVTVLTDNDDVDAKEKYGRETVEEAVRAFALQAQDAGLDGLVASGAEARMLRSGVLKLRPMTINTANIRPAFLMVEGDDQNPNRAMTPAEAIAAGADRLIIGRPITRAKGPRDAVMRTIEEVAEALSRLPSAAKS